MEESSSPAGRRRRRGRSLNTGLGHLTCARSPFRRPAAAWSSPERTPGSTAPRTAAEPGAGGRPAGRADRRDRVRPDRAGDRLCRQLHGLDRQEHERRRELAGARRPGVQPEAAGRDVDPTNGATVYVGTLDDGVYKSEDGGATWTPRNEGLLNLHVSAIVVSPTEPSNVYVGIDNGGAFLSTDGGATWDRLHNGLQGTDVDAHRRQSRRPRYLANRSESGHSSTAVSPAGACSRPSPTPNALSTSAPEIRECSWWASASSHLPQGVWPFDLSTVPPTFEPAPDDGLNGVTVSGIAVDPSNPSWSSLRHDDRISLAERRRDLVPRLRASPRPDARLRPAGAGRRVRGRLRGRVQVDRRRADLGVSRTPASRAIRSYGRFSSCPTPPVTSSPARRRACIARPTRERTGRPPERSLRPSSTHSHAIRPRPTCGRARTTASIDRPTAV